MSSIVNKTIATRGSVLRRASLILRHQNFRLSSFSSVSIESNPILSDEHLQHDEQCTTSKIQDDKSRVRTIRFYRMLLRQCQLLADNTNNANTTNKSTVASSKQATSESFMLQPRVVTSANSMYFRTSPPVATQSFDLFRLFYILVERESVKHNAVGTPILLPPTHPQAIKRNYSSASYAETSTRSMIPRDVSIDDWFYEVTGGQMPTFRNENENDEMRNLLVNTCWTSPEKLRSVMRQAFQTNYTRIDTPELHKWTIRAFQILRDQQDLWMRSSVAVTADRIRTVATCQSGRCLAALAKYKKRPSRRFTYKIRIENLTQDDLQLMGRSLSFQGIDKDGQAYDEPVIDSKMLDRPLPLRTPDVPSTVLRPGQCFEFLGNVNLKTDKGILKGCFHMNKVLASSAKIGMEAIPIGDIIHADIAPLELRM
ncbi:MAG: hypothetical protein SGBAC_011139 [Bacillariaceae sp.]